MPNSIRIAAKKRNEREGMPKKIKKKDTVITSHQAALATKRPRKLPSVEVVDSGYAPCLTYLHCLAKKNNDNGYELFIVVYFITSKRLNYLGQLLKLMTM